MNTAPLLETRPVGRADDDKARTEAIPLLDALGRELLHTSRAQRWWACMRPLLGLVLFVAASQLEWWWLAPLAVFLIFVAVVTVTHDIVHGSLGLSPRQTDWALFVFGAILFESGHAYRITHLQHHRVFPGPDDPEGDPARMTFWGAVLHGPFFLPRLWWWAYRRSEGQAVRRWLLCEAAWAGAALAISIALFPWTPTPLVYVSLAWVGSWVYSLLTVHLPHHHYGPDPPTQTSSLRGWIIPALFLELTYHLEHHLYPNVPSHHLPELSQRLEPFFARHGVKVRRVL
jgi:beta-carotene hydroxylase